MTTEGRVDVVIPAWGTYIPFLSRALASTPNGVRIIAVVDASEGRRAMDAGADVVVERPAGGIAEAREAGLAVVERPFVLFLDSDDVLIDQAVSTLLTPLVEDAGLAAAAGTLRCRSDGRLWPPRRWAELACTSLGVPTLLVRNVLPSVGACLIRTAHLREGPLFPALEDEDWHAVIKLRASGRIHFTTDVVLLYDDRAGSLSRRLRRPELLERSRRRLLSSAEEGAGRRHLTWTIADRAAGLYRRRRDRELVQRWSSEPA